MKTVIIGNSVAGIAAAQAFRSADAASELAIISSEPCAAYSRPLITYYLAGKVEDRRMLYRPADFYGKRSITAMLGRPVRRIDAEEHTVTLADGERVELMEQAWLDAKLEAGGAKPPPPDELERLLLQRTNVANEDVRTVALQRAQAARDYLRDERGLSNERLYLLAPRLAEPGGTLPPQRAELAVK